MENDLGEILIRAFEPLSSHERLLFSRNAFMVGTQIRLVFGKAEGTEILNRYSESDWEEAWEKFNGHFSF